MKEKIDQKTLKLFPYVVFGFFTSVMINIIAPMVKMFSVGRIPDLSISQINSSIDMICHLIMYVSIVGILSCLYHMSIISRWLGAAFNMTGAYILSESAYFIMKWVSGLDGMPLGVSVVRDIFRIVSLACTMMMMIFVMRGASEFYKDNGEEKTSDFCRKINKYWIIAFIMQMLVSVILSIKMLDSKSSIVFIGGAVMVYIYNIVIMTCSYIMIRRYCQNYYIYSYNNGL